MAINVSVQYNDSPRHDTVDPWLLPSGNPFFNGAPFSYRNRTPHLYEIFLLPFVKWLLRAYKYRQLRP